MGDQRLRKVVSDASYQIKNYESSEIISTTTVIEVKQEECFCCGLKEDCTLDYTRKVKSSHLGNWVCGLCTEAVKERLRRDPTNMLMQEALTSHREFCHDFNNTTRTNPKLSLATTLRGIARRSSHNRSSSENRSNLARSISCIPSIDLNM